MNHKKLIKLSLVSFLSLGFSSSVLALEEQNTEIHTKTEDQLVKSVIFKIIDNLVYKNDFSSRSLRDLGKLRVSLKHEWSTIRDFIIKRNLFGITAIAEEKKIISDLIDRVGGDNYKTNAKMRVHIFSKLSKIKTDIFFKQSEVNEEKD